MKVIDLSQENQKKLQAFASEIGASDTRPAVYIGINEDGDPVLYMCELTWKELAYIKVGFEMHVIQDWLGMPG